VINADNYLVPGRWLNASYFSVVYLLNQYGYQQEKTVWNKKAILYQKSGKIYYDF